MPASHFKTADVDYLVAEKKIIHSIPDIVHSSARSEYEIRADVRRKNALGEEIGLIIVARLAERLSGLPASRPRCILEWHGVRIRGLNYSTLHSRPGTAGGFIKGWHEHRWNEQEGDSYIVQANPTPNKVDLRSIVKWGLRKWNIEVKEEQLEV